ncbi:outer membrane beta-barrel protein [Bradyrhizobium sp. LHD-71]|uniref:outer membrane protein n=1 Tax=Bradyrhizobium sp. LHD-71 TaxID=3072141 RepID=UPI00280F361A|nr:outer membrane beta-barrel protein [Bradyrhizobium sp. LHD-71]MDQ8732694.1 outer membrane beta-barrel protein [Bradyrhizobium sp. LHD-71]
MNKTSTFLCAAVAVVAVSAPAVAADMRMPAKALSPPPVVQVYSWTGFYIGGFVGGAVADRDAESTEPRSGTASYNDTRLPSSYDLGSSFIGGGTIGYNWQPVGSQWVIGLEAEAGYLQMKDSALDINSPIGAANGFHSAHMGDWYAVIAGRLGYSFDRVLVYAKGGVAFVDKEYSFIDGCVVAPCGNATLALSNSDMQTTWAVGGGIEWAFAPNWSLKGEYVYLATRDDTTQSAIAGGTGRAAGRTWTNAHSDPGIHTGKIGINYRF